MSDAPFRPLLRNLSLSLATVGGLGWLPIAQGTFGALIGVALTVGTYQIPSFPGRIALLMSLLVIGVPICSYASGRLGQSDPKEVIWDEFVTVPWVFFWLPTEQALLPRTLLIGFALHRAFDIAKPPPLKLLERLPAGWGIMADDLGAAFYACITLHLLRYLFGW